MPYEDMVLATPGIAAYWPLDDAAASSTARDATANLNALTKSGVVGFGAPDVISAIAGEKKSSGAFSASGYLASAIPGYPPIDTGPAGAKTLEVWVQQTAPPSALAYLLSRSTTGITDQAGSVIVYEPTVGQPFILGIPATAKGTTSLAYTQGLIQQAIADINLADGKPHHIVMTVIPGGGAGSSSVVIDGLQKFTWQAGSESGLASVAWIIGQNFNGYIQHAAVYSPSISAHRVRQHFRVGFNYEQYQNGLAESLFVPNAQCPFQGSFDIKSGYAIWYSDLRAWGGIVTCDPTYLAILRSSGFFTESVAP